MMEQIPRAKPKKIDHELVAHRTALPLLARAVLNMELMSQDLTKRSEQREKYGLVAKEWTLKYLDDYSRQQLDAFKRWEAIHNELRATS